MNGRNFNCEMSRSIPDWGCGHSNPNAFGMDDLVGVIASVSDYRVYRDASQVLCLKEKNVFGV